MYKNFDKYGLLFKLKNNGSLMVWIDFFIVFSIFTCFSYFFHHLFITDYLNISVFMIAGYAILLYLVLSMAMGNNFIFLISDKVISKYLGKYFKYPFDQKYSEVYDNLIMSKLNKLKNGNHNEKKVFKYFCNYIDLVSSGSDKIDCEKNTILKRFIDLNNSCMTSENIKDENPFISQLREDYFSFLLEVKKDFKDFPIDKYLSLINFSESNINKIREQINSEKKIHFRKSFKKYLNLRIDVEINFSTSIFYCLIIFIICIYIKP